MRMVQFSVELSVFWTPLRAFKAYNLKAKVATFTIGSSYDITNTLLIYCLFL